MTRVMLIAALVVSGILSAPRADAQMNCIVTVVPLTFGTYAPGDAIPLDANGQIDVSCRGQPGLISVAISQGSSGNFASREMRSGTFVMLYNVFVNAARSVMWADGLGGTAVQNLAKGKSGREDFSLPAYGRVPAQQSVGAGNYFDDLIVTVSF
jgi:spore coat protein U-like protein